MKKFIAQNIRNKRFVCSDDVPVMEVLAASRAFSWKSLDAAIDFLLDNDLTDEYQVVDFDTMRVEFCSKI